MESMIRIKNVTPINHTYLDPAANETTSDNKPIMLNGLRPVKAKVNVSSIANVRSRDRDRSPLRSNTNKASPVHTPRGRSPSPSSSHISARTSLNSTSRPKSPARVSRGSPGNTISSSSSTVGTASSLKARSSTLSVTKRASTSRVQSPAPSLSVHTLRTVASAYSLPPSPTHSQAPSVASLKPIFSRRHGRPASISDTSSLSATTPSSTSAESLGTCDANSDVVDRRTRARTLLSESSPLTNNAHNESISTAAPIRIKSKVTKIAVSNNPPGTPPLSLSPPQLPSSMSTKRPTRQASISSAAGSVRSSTPISPREQQFHPSSPSSSAYRSTTPRPSSAYHYQPFPIPSLPAPPPPSAIEHLLSHSPPQRAKSPRLSFSAALTPPRTAVPLETPGDANIHSGLGPPCHDIPDEVENGREAEAEAKTNRKIADLEITNRSLLAINTTLEATKARQAREISELRRKLRETRLTLPPKVYAALEPNDHVESDPDDGEEDSSAAEEVDPLYDRIQMMIQQMLGHATEALKPAPKHIGSTSDGTLVMKVLTAAEVQAYQGESKYDKGKKGSVRSGNGSEVVSPATGENGNADDRWDGVSVSETDFTDADVETEYGEEDGEISEATSGRSHLDGRHSNDPPLVPNGTKTLPLRSATPSAPPPLVTITSESPASIKKSLAPRHSTSRRSPSPSR